jgi:hypothetical protein
MLKIPFVTTHFKKKSSPQLQEFSGPKFWYFIYYVCMHHELALKINTSKLFSWETKKFCRLPSCWRPPFLNVWSRRRLAELTSFLSFTWIRSPSIVGCMKIHSFGTIFIINSPETVTISTVKLSLDSWYPSSV